MSKKIYQFQTITDNNLNNDLLLGIVGDPSTGMLFKPTIAQLKTLFTTVPNTDDSLNDFTVINVLNTPPGSPAVGDQYRAGTAPTGGWIANNIMFWDGTVWNAIAPTVNDYVFQTIDAKTYQYKNDNTWHPSPGIAILNNGNKIGHGVNIGTNNNQNLVFKTNKINRLTVDTNGVLKYSADVSGSYDARSLVDKAYVDSAITGKQDQLNGTGFVKITGTTISYDNSTYLTSANYIVRETPSGTINGSNTVFVLANTPIAGKEMVFENGQLQESGGGDYSISGATITFVTAPPTGAKIVVTYLK